MSYDLLYEINNLPGWFYLILLIILLYGLYKVFYGEKVKGAYYY